jgi:hypothetical protein
MAAGSSPIATFGKDPIAVSDFTVDWWQWLGDDTIATVVWTLPVGIANAGTTSSSSTTTIWLSGGTAGSSYSVFVTITTAGGRTEKRTIKINVIEK